MPTGSHSDPAVPLVSIHTPLHAALLDASVPPQIPRPRPSLQIYYVAPDAGSPAVVESVARTLQTRVLAQRNQGGDPGMNDRLDVYGIPGGDVRRCVEHQTAEVDLREHSGLGREWLVQRYDLALGPGREGWRRAVVMVQKPIGEWEDGMGLEIVWFDAVVGDAEGKGRRVDGQDGAQPWEPVRVLKAADMEDALELVVDLRHSLNWQHTRWQFDD